MGKRFTDTDKFKKPFYRGLNSSYKLLWDYVCSECDHAGIWIVDFEIAEIYIGKDCSINKPDALKFFNDGDVRIVEFDNGTKWFILPFVEFQYGVLNPSNRAHNSAIQILEKHKLINKQFKPLTSPLQGAKDKDKDKVKDKVKYKDNVSLLESEYNTLLKKDGKLAVDWMLDKLSNYKLANGKKYASDYGAINSWVRKEYEKQQGTNETKPIPFA